MNEANKAVIIMYPDCRTTGGNPGRDNGRIPSDRLLSSGFFKNADRLLGRYQDQCYQVYGVVYKNTQPENFSPLYPYSRFDELIPLKVDLKHWKRERHRELLEEMLLKLPIVPEAKTIVGGYHTFDCVALMARILSDKGFAVSADLRLTTELGRFLLIAHKVKQMMGQMHGKEDR